MKKIIKLLLTLLTHIIINQNIDGNIAFNFSNMEQSAIYVIVTFTMAAALFVIGKIAWDKREEQYSIHQEKAEKYEKIIENNEIMGANEVRLIQIEYWNTWLNYILETAVSCEAFMIGALLLRHCSWHFEDYVTYMKLYKALKDPKMAEAEDGWE